jgi:phenylacetate-CoA ligase
VKEAQFLAALNSRSRCQYIYGYANELHNLAVRSLQDGPRLRRPLKAVIATAEPLTEAMRATIERAFQCPVYNRYGSREAGDIASECQHQRGLHVNPLFTRLEVVDDLGQPLRYGQEGQFLVTNLHNKVMPLIRYAIGDRGVLRAPERCSCGVSWPTIVALTGRVNDWVFLSDGSRLRCSVLESVLVKLPALKRFQIHQVDETSLRIRLSSVDPDYLTHRSHELAEARRKLNLLSGAPFDVQFEVTDGALYKTQAGKQPLITYASSFHRAHAQRADMHTRLP